MAAAVQVLCPNGRRQNVKITPNTKILQILEEVCSKQGFDADGYNLVHGNKLLDVTLTVRFSGLPNHAKLELKKADVARSESNVTVALVLESGERLTESFSPGHSLWSLLSHWESQKDFTGKGVIMPSVEESHPVCIYMREEFIGEEQLKETTLRSLGLTQGKMMLRFTHRVVDSDVLTKIKENIKKEKLKQERKNVKSAQHTAEGNDDVLDMKEDQKVQHSKSSVQSATCGKPSAVQEISASKEEPMEMSPSPETVDKRPVSTSDSGANIHKKKNRVSESEGRNTDSEQPGIEIAGRMIRTQEDFNQLMAEMMQRERAAMAAAAAANVGAAQGASVPTKSGKQKPVKKEPREAVEPCERESVLYNLDDMSAISSTSEEPGEDFFEVTEKDVKRMMKDLQEKCASMDDQPLMTESLRKAQFEKKIAKYKYSVIRIQFPDRNVLQGLFKPQETVETLYKYVKTHLKDTSSKFYLYTTPPRSILKDMNVSLAEAGLVPLSVVHFGRDSSASLESPLSSAVLKEISAPSVADSVVMKSMPQSETKTVKDQVPAGTSDVTMDISKSDASDDGNAGKSSTSRGATDKPKWFMVGRK